LADLEALPEISIAARGRMNCLEEIRPVPIQFEEEIRDDLNDGDVKLVGRYMVGPGFLDVVGIPLLKGRDFEYGDGLDTDPVVLVNQALLETYFSNEDPLTVRFHAYRSSNPLSTVIGVVPDILVTPEIRSYPVIFMNSNQRSMTSCEITARATVSEGLAKRAVEKMLNEKYGFLVIYRVSTYSELIADSTARLHSSAIMVTTAGLMALVMSIGGLFVVFSYSAVLYQHDFSIRMALGASPRHIVLLAFRRFGTICLAGLLVGIGCALFLTPLTRESLSTLPPRDPLTYAISILLVLITVTLISLTVSLRFLRLEPARELQE